MIFAVLICFNPITMKIPHFFQKPLLPAVLLSLFFLPSCDLSSDIEDRQLNEKLQIQDFLSDNDTLHFELKTSGLYYLDYVPGTGPQAETHDTAYIYYAMHLLNRSLVESNFDTSDTLIKPVNEGKLIPGFDEALTYMKEGGTSLIVVPSKLAYGEQGNYYISPYTPFIFQINLVKLDKHIE